MIRLCLPAALVLALAGALPAAADDRPPPARPKVPRDAPQFTSSSGVAAGGVVAGSGAASATGAAPKAASLPALIGGSGAPGTSPRTR